MEHSPEKEKYKNGFRQGVWRRRLLRLTGNAIVVVMLGFAFWAGAAKQCQCQPIRIASSTGTAAYVDLDRFMPLPYPSTLSNIKNPAFSAVVVLNDLVYQTFSISMPPEDYQIFIEQTKNPTRSYPCVSLPLKPEGIQEKPGGCRMAETLTISIDKSNPALWRITFDIR